MGATVRAQAPAAALSPVDPLPQDTGSLGLKQMLVRLKTTGRLMQTTAHPDDEDGPLLTLQSRGHGISTLLFTLTRGEGGQNKLGSNLFDVLGVVRTLELTAADKYYGVQQRFSHVADFGYSKNPEETFQKWQGHDIALSDMVRVIRTFRPDVLVARFSGTDRDGHGHHQASSILTQEAFRSAADPNKFPEQIQQGLLPWQAKKLYIGNVCGFGATSCAAGNYTVKMNTGETDPALGMSFAQFAINEGLRHQLSQGAGGWTVDPGDRFAFYKLVDSVVESKKDKDGHEQDLFDGIDTSLPGLAKQLGKEEQTVAWLEPALTSISDRIASATAAAEKAPADAAEPLIDIVQELRKTVARVEKSDLGISGKQTLLMNLREKQEQAERALNLAMNVSLQVQVLTAPPDSAEKLPSQRSALTTVSPGQIFTLYVKFHNGSKHPLAVDNVSLEGFTEWTQAAYKGTTTPIPPGEDLRSDFRLQVPANVQYTRPYWHRTDPELESLNTIDVPAFAGLPFPPSPFRVVIRYSLASQKGLLPSWSNGVHRGTSVPAQISAPVLVPFINDEGHPDKRVLAVVPAFSVMLDPGEQVIPASGGTTTAKVSVTSNLEATSTGTLRLEVPQGWRIEPAQLSVTFHHRGEKQEFAFKTVPTSLREGKARLRAVLTSGGREYSEGYTEVTRSDLDTFYYYQPAVQRVSIVDVKVPNDIKVGYIMGAGDDIPTVLQQIGINLTIIPAETVGSVDLSGYHTLVLGIRAYDTQKNVAANNKKLLEFVAAGGTLVVQYNASTAEFNGGHFTPYPAQLSRARVSVEDAPVDILAPADGVFRYPNAITTRDFDGWVQERGLYFMDTWDDHFKPLLACHDPGEQAQRGGLLKADYGKGMYIYAGYAFFRQLPAGVPGAIRLYVNLLSQSATSVASRQ